MTFEWFQRREMKRQKMVKQQQYPKPQFKLELKQAIGAADRKAELEQLGPKLRQRS